MMRKAILAVILAAAFTTSAMSAEPAKTQLTPKQQDILRLLKATKALDAAFSSFTPMFDQMSGMLKATVPNLPDRALEILKEEIMAGFRTGRNELAYKTMQIYDAHLSHEDVREMIAFYKTPTGQRVVQVLPVIMQKSVVMGQEWGQGIAQQAVARAQPRWQAEGLLNK